ncbi:MAG: methylamine methyltransferase corrinoid protein reductive activase [Clostridiales bacterium]|jgi:methylamine methyltransferase corrinoid protein reductive activase|nr:methylamine methyltransferase corrinoid protein reductive activase [Clostridiales bacterium]
MKKIGIALDLGTSGFRGQAIDLETKRILKTVMTARHPLPGANVIDHLNFAIDAGSDAAHQIIIITINQIIGLLRLPGQVIERLAVCGNPIQLSLFENIEIRDLAYAGENKKRLLGIVPPDRGSKEYPASHFPELDINKDCHVFIPPAVEHEIGADALAMLVLSGILEQKEICLATDYGTNAEMALKVGDKIFTGSCAAGPALEGQHIESGMLAAPGAIADIHPEGTGHRCLVLNEEMQPEEGDLVSLESGAVLARGKLTAKGVTGTGVVAALSRGFDTNLIRLPYINTPSTYLHLANGIRFGEDDLLEAGKAIGALRAGYLTLTAEAGIAVEDINTAYMAGASGTYVDAVKAMRIGMVPPRVKEIHQVGNTSLTMAREIVLNPARLRELDGIAGQLRASHCMFGNSKVFEKAYLLELSYWTEGMPWEQYEKFSKMYRLPALPQPKTGTCAVTKVPRDILDVGAAGVVTIEKVGFEKKNEVEGCISCGHCIKECPERALQIDDKTITMRMDYCSGTACRRCEHVCPEKVFQLNTFWL